MLFGLQNESVDHYVRGLMGGLGQFFLNEEVISICESCTSTGGKKSIYKIVPREGALEKYGESVKRFIPNKELNTEALKKLDVKLIVS